MTIKCPYVTGKLKTCGGQLIMLSEKQLEEDSKQISGLAKGYTKQLFRCNKCGRKLKRFFIWQEVQDYE